MPRDFIADAASVIVLRHAAGMAQVLMGQRGATAAFMPSKFVFPGGRVDCADFDAPPMDLIAPKCHAALQAQLREGSAGNLPGALSGVLPRALIAAALRELAEETGLSLCRPHPRALRFMFRAITPPGRTRRFDARFFIADHADFAGDSVTFAGASGELNALQWLPLPAARALDLPFITRVILAEVEAGLAAPQPGGVPFFDNRSTEPAFARL